MFRKNGSHLQRSLLGIESQLPESKLKKLRNSKEAAFYRLVFCQIKEEDFAILYSVCWSRPNAPVNSLVASILLMQHNGWTTEQLFDRIDFDLLTRTALGLDRLDDTPFCPATFFNFQNRLLAHFTETGENLLESVFDNLTQRQLKTLKVRTDIQRSDSFMAMSNIRSYSRTQLLIEMVIRLHRVLSEEDKERVKESLWPYVKQSSGQYVYKLDRSAIPHELAKLGEVCHKLHRALKESYGDIQVFRVFERVYNEHFTVVEDKVEVKPNEQLTGGTLQSPDDIDATYRTKNGGHYRGQSVNLTETANPENEINLLTDVAVCSNNTDDSEILNKRLEHMKQKTPDLKELHTDGAYGNGDNDRKMEQLGITHVQTAVRGRKAEVAMEIEERMNGRYVVRCPHQCVTSQKAITRNKACFDVRMCNQCSSSRQCPAKHRRNKRVYYFDRGDYLFRKRSRNMESLPPERRKLRPNVEATVKEFTKPLNHKGKLKVRGGFKTMLYAYSMGISINFGRVYRHIAENPSLFPLVRSIRLFLLGLLGGDIRSELTEAVVGAKSCRLAYSQVHS